MISTWPFFITAHWSTWHGVASSLQKALATTLVLKGADFSILFTASSYPANSTCWAGRSSPADRNKTGWLYFCKWKLCKCSDLCNHLFLWFSSSVSDHFSRIRVVCDTVSKKHPYFFLVVPLCCFWWFVPSVAWGEDGIEELHVVGYVYQELLVSLILLTYMQHVCLHYTVCVWLYTYIQHVE